MTHLEIIRQHLLDGNTFTAASAYILFDIISPQACVCKLRKEGLPIRTTYEYVSNSNSVRDRYACYSIGEPDPVQIKWPPKTTSFNRFPGESKQKAVIRFISEYGSITTIEGFTEIFAYRLSGIIHTLRKKGYSIVTTMVDVPGRQHKVAQYSFE